MRILSFWDSMLWSVAKDTGVTILLSEDLQDGRELGGVWFFSEDLEVNMEDARYVPYDVCSPTVAGKAVQGHA